MKCPDHQRELVPTAAGLSCPLCRGALMTHEQLVEAAGAVVTLLEAEHRPDAHVFKKPRSCPDCAAVMTPLRIGRLEAWVERCARCERLWVEPADLRSLTMTLKARARQDAWAAMDVDERRALAQALAASQLPAPDELTPLGQRRAGGWSPRSRSSA